MSDEDFRFVASLIGEHAGISLSEVKRDLVYGRLVRRLRALGLDSFGEYCALLSDRDGEEFQEFVNALTTNLTSFFREAHHFEYLQGTLLPALMAEPGRRSLRIWSAGCSTGPEPYSLAMVLAETVPADWDTRILATDIDSRVLETASAGIYTQEVANRGISPERQSRWLLRGRGAQSGMVRARPELQRLLTFRKLNLLGPWPFRGQFDVVFCRNVIIYFDKPTQCTLFQRVASHIPPGGHLFIGHSENLNGVSDAFRLVGKTVYRREGGSPTPVEPHAR